MWLRSPNLPLNFGTPVYMWMAKDIKFKFGVRIQYNEYYRKIQN